MCAKIKEDGFTCDICKKFKYFDNDEIPYQFSVKRKDSELGLVTDCGFTICNCCRNANIHLFPVINLVGVKLEIGSEL